MPAGAISHYAGLTSLVEAMSHVVANVTHHGRGHEVQPLFNPARTRLDFVHSLLFSFIARRAAASYLL
jgi:hypothetical protein